MLDALFAFSQAEYLWLGGAIAVVIIVHYLIKNLKLVPSQYRIIVANLPFGGGIVLFYLSVFLVSNFAPFAAIVMFIIGAGLISLELPLSEKSEAAWVKIIIIPAMLFGFAMMGYFLLVSPYLDHKLITEGEPALATILEVKPTGNLVNEQPEVKLVLEVRPERGKSYQAEKRMVISPVYLPQFQPGVELKVKVDPKKPTRLAVEAIRQRER